MGYFRNSLFRVREQTVNGVTTLVDVAACYVSLEVNPKLQTTDVNTNCTLGSRKVPDFVDPEITIEIKPTTVDVTAFAGLLAPGSVVGLEIVKNPTQDDGTATPTNNLIIEVVRFATVVGRPDANQNKQLTNRRIELMGGDYYAERVGRTGFPAPYSSATNS